MPRLLCFHVKGEVVTPAAGRLIVLATDFVASQVTQQQGSDAAVRDDSDVAVTKGASRDDLIDSGDNSALRIGGGFPSANALPGSGEKLTGYSFKFFAR
jgi:hypothetical protein